MDDQDQLEEIIREIATRHGIAVSRDDPILILQTINNRLLLNSAKVQGDLLDRFKQELEQQASRWTHDAKERADRVLNASLAAAKDASSDLFNEAWKESASQLKVEHYGILAGVAETVRDARRVAVLNLIAACISTAAAAIAFWAIHT
jgi:hypothetical protein